MKIVILVCALVFCGTAYADAYACKIGKETLYTNTPCAPNAKTLGSNKSRDPLLEKEIARRSQQDVDRMKEGADYMQNQRVGKYLAQQAAQEQMQRQAIQQQQHAVPANTYQPQGSGALQRQYPQQATAAQESRESFANRGGILRQPAGSSFEYDDNGNSYHRPEGGAFSYGKGGTTCFHYGAFADCK